MEHYNVNKVRSLQAAYQQLWGKAFNHLKESKLLLDDVPFEVY